VTTKAWLDGDGHDLQYLTTLLPCGDVQVGQDGDRFYLASTELDNPPPGEQFHDVAEKLVTWINGLARCQNPAFLPVGLRGSYERDGGVTVVGATATLVVRAHMSATAVVTEPDGTPKPPAAPPGSRYLAAAARNADVAEVLKILGKPGEPHFVELYKVWEIVRHAGGMQAAMQSAGISENTMTRFKRTANHQAASGDSARHARLPEAPPPSPMPIGEARALIGKLVNAWIATL
jgi:hypothetical protein